MRSLSSRLARLESLEARFDVPLCERTYYLPYAAYPRVVVEAFRAGNLLVQDGRIATDTTPARSGAWRCAWLADVLNTFAGWGDVFMDAAEITAARELLALGWIGLGRSFTEVAPYHQPPRWQVLLGHAATHELYTTDPARYFAVHATGRTLGPAIAVAAWRLGTPITTLDQVHAWIGDARPLTLSMPMIKAIGPIAASALVAHTYGYDLDQLERADDDEEL